MGGTPPCSPLFVDDQFCRVDFLAGAGGRHACPHGPGASAESLVLRGSGDPVLGAGAAFGYLLGYALWDPVVEPFISAMGYHDKIDVARQWFSDWGIWVIFIASFTPVPYKVFTVTAGLLHMAFLPFILISLVGRGMRFFLVSGLMVWGGVRMERKLIQYIDLLGWLCVVAAVIAYLLLRN